MTTTPNRREKRPLNWKLVLLFLLLLPILPIYLWRQGRLSPTWAAGLTAVFALLFGGAIVTPAPEDKKTAEAADPAATRASENSSTPTPGATPTPTTSPSPTAPLGFADVAQVEESEAAAVASEQARVKTEAAAAKKKAAAEAAKKAAAAERKRQAAADAAAKKKAADLAAEKKRKADAAAKAAQAAAASRTDPHFDTCGDANDHGFGNYRSGVDPEYDWYQDRDGDGIVCEFR